MVVFIVLPSFFSFFLAHIALDKIIRKTWSMSSRLKIKLRNTR